MAPRFADPGKECPLQAIVCALETINPAAWKSIVAPADRRDNHGVGETNWSGHQGSRVIRWGDNPGDKAEGLTAIRGMRKEDLVRKGNLNARNAGVTHG